jgi:hypothetical protein
MKRLIDRFFLAFLTTLMVALALSLGGLLFSSIRHGPDWTTAGWVVAVWVGLSFSAASVWGVCFLRKRRSPEGREEV